MTSFTDEETYQLIENIRQHPALFNCQLEEYKDDILKDNIWKSIGEGLNKSDKECRKKWKLIKDSYNRLKRKQKHSTESAAPSKNSKWELFKNLSFLEYAPTERESTANIADSMDSPTEILDAIEVSLVKKVGKTSQTSIQEINTNTEKQRSWISKRKKNDDQQSMMERQENLQTISTVNLQQPIDEISSFAKNIEMSLRKLSVRSRSMAKNEIFNVITKYEMIDIDDGHSF